jgi:hypothetical protein
MKLDLHRRSLALLTLTSFCLQLLPAAAQPAPPSMDMSSTERTASDLTDNVVIRTAAGMRMVDSSSLLTPAERAAAMQVLSGGRQSLFVGSQGNAVGGSFSVGSGAQVDISTLVIPKGVSSITNAQNVNIAGNLVNYGVLAVESALANINGSKIVADNIFNHLGASITSAVPLNLTAASKIVNSGSIAANHLSVSSPSVVNSGSMDATAGNINLSSPVPGHIVFDNTGGTMAATGNINVRDAAFSGKYDFLLKGGNVIANSVNIFSGDGTVKVNVDDLTGVLNISAGAAHVLTSTPNLTLGAMNITGDPTYFNQGDITISNPISTSGQPVAIISSGNVLGQSGGSISTSHTGNAGTILIIAGAAFSTAPPNALCTNCSTGAAGDTTTTVTVTGGTSGGGRIDLSGFSSKIDASAPSGGAGANVTMLAFGGASAQSGSVTVTQEIDTSAASASSGNVVIIGGASSGTGISVAAIDTSNSNGTGGAITLLTANPRISKTDPIVVIDGTLNGASAGIINSSGPLPSSVALNGALTTVGAPITVVSGANISIGGSMTTTSTFTPPPNGPGGLVSLFAAGNIATSAASVSINTNGGSGSSGSDVIMVSGARLQPTFSQTVNSPTPDELSMTVLVTGPSSTGGSIDLTGGGSNNLQTLSTIGGLPAGANGYRGGSVQLVAFGGSGTSSGTVTLPSALNVQTGGSPSTSGGTIDNRNGDFIVVAGAATGQAITLGNVDTSGSNAGGGNVTILTAQPAGGLPFSYTFDNGAGSPLVTTGSFVTNATVQSASATVGSITAEGGSASFPFLAGGNTATTTVLVSAGNNLSIGAVTNTNNALPDGNAGGFNGNGSPSSSILLTAGGTMTLSGNVDSSASGAPVALPFDPPNPLGIDGGLISLTAGTFASSGTITITANGFNSSNVSGYSTTVGTGGSGGTVSITSTGSGSNVSIGTGANNFTISAQGGNTGGNGGSVSIASGQNISVTTSALSISPQLGSDYSSTPNSFVTGTGGNVALTASQGTVFVNGNLDASGAASTVPTGGGAGNLGGNGGSIAITVNTSAGNPFNVGGATVSSGNGTTAAITANGNMATGGSIASFGSGGSISITNLGAGGITIASNALQVAAAGAVDNTPPLAPVMAGAGGQIKLQSSAAGGTVFSAGPLNADGGSSSPTLNSGDGGSIEIITNSKTAFAVDSAATTNGVAGAVSASGLVGATPTPTNGNAGLLLVPTGNGGSVSITNLGTGGVGVGESGGNSLISVAAANADNFLTGGANLPGHNRAGQGGNITLNAPTGPVLSLATLDASGGSPNTVPGALQNDGGNGGSITIINKGSSQFRIGGTYTVSSNQVNDGPTSTTYGTGNGVAGAITANGYSGGKISVTSLGTKGTRVGLLSPSTVSISAQATVPTAPSNDAAGGTGGKLELLAPSGPVLILASLSVNGSNGNSTPGYSTGGPGGSISITSNSSTSFSIGGSATVNGIVGGLSANGGAGNISGGAGGTISVANLGAGGVSIVTASSVTVTAPDAISGQAAGDGGSISLLAPKGPVSITGDLSAAGGAGFTSTTDPYSILVQPPSVNSGASIPSAVDTGYARGLGGSIVIVSGSSKPFVAGASSATPNGSTGSITTDGWSGGSITIINNVGGITINSGSLSAGAQDVDTSIYFNNLDQRYLGGPGGNISLQAPKNTVFIDGGLSVNGGASGTTSANNFFPGGPGGQISIITSSTKPFVLGSSATTNGSTGALTATGGSDGGIISINNNGTGGISIDPTMIDVSAVVGGDTTGTSSYLFDNPIPPPASYSIDFPSDGNGGAGGRIYLNALGTGGKVFIDKDGNGFSLNVNGGASGTTQGIAGNGGVISIVTNSTTPFNIGGATSGSGTLQNGTAGILSAAGYNGGTIGVKNFGTGGVSFNPTSISVSASLGANATVSDPAGGNGGNIDLQAPNGTLLANSVASPLRADAQTNAQATSQGGSIVLNAKLIKTSGSSPLILSAEGDTTVGNMGVGGYISVTQTSTKATDILSIGKNGTLNFDTDSSLTDGTINVTSSAGISVAGKLTTGNNQDTGSITLAVTGKSNIVSASGLVATGNLNLKTVTGSVGSSSGALDTAINNAFTPGAPLGITFSSQGGSLYIDNTGDLSVGNVSNTAPKTTISIATIGTMMVEEVVSTPGTLVLAQTSVTSCPTCSLFVNKPVFAGTATLTADGSGTGGLIQTAPGALISATTLTLNATADGVNIETATGSLTLKVDGVAGATSINVNNHGNLVVSAGNTQNVDSLTITSSGSIATSGKFDQFVNVTLDNAGAGNQSITLADAVGNGQSGSTVTINAGGSIIQSGATSGTNIIQAETVVLSSRNGNIGVPTRNFDSNNVWSPQGTAIQVNTTSLSATAFNSDTLESAGTININNVDTSGNMDIASIKAGSDVVVTYSGSITVSGAVESVFGGILLQNTDTSDGTIDVNANLSANGGPLVVLNANTSSTSGLVNIANSVVLTGNSWSSSGTAVNSLIGVFLLAGVAANPAPGAGSPFSPAPTVNGSAANILYGTQSITAAGGIVINVPATAATINPASGTEPSGTLVAFNSAAADGINLGTNVTINALNQFHVLTSLTASSLSAAAGNTGSGVTQNGNTYTLDNTVSMSNMSSLNLPGSITVQVNNSAAVIAVNTLSGKNASLAGDINVPGVSSNTLVSVNSTITGNVLAVTGSGSITSGGDLALNVGGNVQMAGALSAGSVGNLIINTGAGVASGAAGPTKPFAGTVALTGQLSAGTVFDTGAIFINASGNITQTGGSIRSSRLELASQGANSGFAASFVNLKNARAYDLLLGSMASGGSVTLSGKDIAFSNIEANVGDKPVTISQTSGFGIFGTVFGVLKATSSSSITTNNDLACGTCTLTTPSLTFTHLISNTAPQGTITVSSTLPSGLVITGTDGITAGSILANAGLTITSKGLLTATGGSFATNSGALLVSAAKDVNLSDVVLISGDGSGFLGGPIFPTMVTSTGSLLIRSTGGAVTANVLAQSIGADLSILATKNVALQGQFLADGGNLFLTSGSGQITGSSSLLSATAIGTTAGNARGGLIQISTGFIVLSSTALISPTLTFAPGALPVTPPIMQPDGSVNALGSNVGVVNSTGPFSPTGAVSITTKGAATVNLGTDTTLQTVLTLQGGGILVTAGKGSINFETTQFSTSAFSPIAFTQRSLPVSDALEICGSDNASVSDHLIWDQSGLVKLSERNLDSRAVAISPTRDLTIRSRHGEVRIKKGALALIAAEDDGCRVIACSGPNHVTMVVDGRSITLAPGQEVLVSSNVGEGQTKADGIGRRNFRQFSSDAKFVGICEVSLITVLSNRAELKALRAPRTVSEKRLAESLLRTAAAVCVLTQNRGPFHAVPKDARHEHKSQYKPVSYAP